MKAQYCFSCMNELAGQVAICPYCHASQPYHMQDPNDLPAGMILKKRYLIGRILGRGGFGATYIARDLKNNKILTIKEYFPDFACVRNPGSNDVAFKNGKEDKFLSYQEEFKAEAQHLKLLKGTPGVVQFYEYFEAFGTSYLVLEYLDGKTLKDVLLAQQRPFAVNQAVDYILRTLQVLSRVHAKGILHRDISPDNIFLTNNGQIHLIDFGSSSLSSQTTMTGFTKGVYTAPEQRINGAQGPATDLYAVGVTLFTLLTNHKPKEAEGVQLEKLPDVFPPYLQEIYEKATQHEMNQRYQRAEEMALALSQASGVPLPVAPSNRNRKLKKLLIAMVSLVAILVVVMALAFSGSGNSPTPAMPLATRVIETAIPAVTNTPAPTDAPVLPENTWLYRQNDVLYLVSSEKTESIPAGAYPVEEAQLQPVELRDLERCHIIYALSGVKLGMANGSDVLLTSLSDVMYIDLLPGEYEIIAVQDGRELREKFIVPAAGPIAFSGDGENTMIAWWNDEEAITEAPSIAPSAAPTEIPMVAPEVTEEPTAMPTAEPTLQPTQAPTATPTAKPTAEPTEEPHSHIWTAVPAQEPTCTESGNKAYRFCKDCGEIDGSSEDIPALGHDWMAATCVSPKTCLRCDAQTGTTAPHRYGDWMVERQADCDSYGISCTSCEFCGEKQWQISGDLLGHDYVNGVCSRCGEKKNSELSANADACVHDWREATCTKPQTCTLCGERRGSANGHDWQAATCTAPQTCSVCASTRGRAKDHDWQEATCITPKTCARCGLTDGEPTEHYFADTFCLYCGEMKPCDHTWQAATCVSPATCTSCGMTEGEPAEHYFADVYCIYCGEKAALAITLGDH